MRKEITMKKLAAIATLIATAALASVAHGEGWAVGARAGTLGLGAELVKSFTPTINGRIGYNAFSYDKTSTEDDVSYDVGADLSTMGAMLDWHVFRGAFRVTAGLMANGNGADLKARPSASFDIGDATYTPEEVGTLRGNVDFHSTAPYLGIGWGNAVSPGSRIGFNLDVGVLLQGAPTVKLSADGLLADDPTFQENLAKEQQQLEEETRDLKFWPALSLGITVRL
jgi:hypothetical protein